MTSSIDTTAVRRVAHTVNRFVIRADDAFANVRRRFEELVPAMDVDGLTEAIKTGDLSVVQAFTAEHTPHSFANFWTLDPIALMTLHGNNTRAVTYMMGNNVIAETMYRHDAGIMLYAPIRVAIYTDAEDHTFLSVDQPSTRFGSFDNPDIAAVGRLLDQKLATVLDLLGVPVPHELAAPGTA